MIQRRSELLQRMPVFGALNADTLAFILMQMNLAREVSRRLQEADALLFAAKAAATDLGGDYRW